MRRVYFDLETTGPPDGPDPEADKILQFAFVDLTEAEEPWVVTVSPGEEHLPIPEERTDVHGIRTEDVRDRPRFPDYAGAVQAVIEDAVLVGYGSRGYDVPVLDRELRAADWPGLRKDPASGIITHPEIDLLEAWRAAERRDLRTADARFGRGELTADAAHDAAADAAALPAVLKGMAAEFDLPIPEEQGGEEGGVDEDVLDAWRRPGLMDRHGCFRRREEDGVPVFAFGKHRGRPAVEEAEYLEWMLRADFPEETTLVARALLADARRRRRQG